MHIDEGSSSTEVSAASSDAVSFETSFSGIFPECLWRFAKFLFATGNLQNTQYRNLIPAFRQAK